MLYFIGLGLGDAKDISLRGLEIVKKCSRVYLEAYTSILMCQKETLEEFYGRDVIPADREMVEQNSDEILSNAETEDIAFLVVGDPFGATTHTDLVIRAHEKGIKYQVVHNASIMNAIGCCGLQLYKFGETVSFVFWEDNWKPESYFDKIEKNKKNGMHTLCLLDIKVKEQTVENLLKGNKIYEPPRYMPASMAAQQLMEIIERRESEGIPTEVKKDTMCVGVARVGTETQEIVAGPLESLVNVDLGKPLHSFVVAGELHELELEMLQHFRTNKS